MRGIFGEPMTSVRPTIPFHIARAYGVARVRRRPRPSPRHRKRVSKPEMSREDAAREKLARLIAARVPGGIDFTNDEPVPSAGAIPMYRHPADRNAAATGVVAGRVIDVVG